MSAVLNRESNMLPLAKALHGGLRLEIDSGPQQGAVHVDATGAFAIGSALENDVVLLAGGLAGRHARVALVGGFRPAVSVTALEAGIRTDDGDDIGVGQSVTMQLPGGLTLGAAHLRLHPARRTAALLRVGGSALAALGAVVVILPLFAAWIAPSAARLSVDLTPPLSAPPPAALRQAAIPPQPVWDDTALRERIAKAGLSTKVVVSFDGASVVATGTIVGPEADAWREIVRWHDAQPRFPTLLNGVVKREQSAPLPVLKAVWRDAKPQLVTAQGEVAGIGDVVGSGWLVDAIGPTEVTLSRDGFRTQLPY